MEEGIAEKGFEAWKSSKVTLMRYFTTKEERAVSSVSTCMDAMGQEEGMQGERESMRGRRMLLRTHGDKGGEGLASCHVRQVDGERDRGRQEAMIEAHDSRGA